MPFRQSARLELANLTTGDFGPFRWRIEYDKNPAALPAADLEYFHACFRTSRPVPLNSTHFAMETTGRGKFVGLVWSCHWLNAEQKPEGTQNFWVDGRRIACTGSEDYFGRAWGFGNEPECHGYKGISLGPEPSASDAVPSEWRRVTAYRAHFLDPIHFQQSLKLDFTCYGYNRGHRTDDYATACFWYQTEPHTPFAALPPIEDLLPLDHPQAFGLGMYRIAQAERRRDFPAALAEIENLLRQHPRNAKVGDLGFKQACLLEEMGRTTEALALFRRLHAVARDPELVRDAADKSWLLEKPGRLLLKGAAPSDAEFFLNGHRIVAPADVFAGLPAWGQPEVHRFTYPPMNVAWDTSSSSIMRLPTIRLEPGPGQHLLAVRASAAPDRPVFTPRTGYFFAVLDLAGPDVVSDSSWQISESPLAGWELPDFPDRDWRPSTVHPLSLYGDGAWSWLWPRSFRSFPAGTERIWSAAALPEAKGFAPTVYFRKSFVVPR